MVGGSAAAATVVALPDCLTPAEKLDHMWSKESHLSSPWTYPSLGGGPVSLQPVSPGRENISHLLGVIRIQMAEGTALLFFCSTENDLL